MTDRSPLPPHVRIARQWGSNVRAARQNLGLNQTQFAQRVGMTQTTVSRYERGEGPWTPEVMLNFAVALDSTIAELFPWGVGLEDAERFRQMTARKAEVA